MCQSASQFATIEVFDDCMQSDSLEIMSDKPLYRLAGKPTRSIKRKQRRNDVSMLAAIDVLLFANRPAAKNSVSKLDSCQL